MDVGRYLPPGPKARQKGLPDDALCKTNIIIDELDALVVFANECFETLSETFKSVTLQITIGDNNHILAGKKKEKVVAAAVHIVE